MQAPYVRVYMDDGEDRGVLDTASARILAESLGLDLVEIDSRIVPPACRIMDYRAHRDARKQVECVAVIPLRIRTTREALDREVARIRRHLAQGTPCHVTVIFRGHFAVDLTEQAQRRLELIASAVRDLGAFEQAPRLEGRRYVAVLEPIELITD